MLRPGVMWSYPNMGIEGLGTAWYFRGRVPTREGRELCVRPLSGGGHAEQRAVATWYLR